jgi:thiol:disulfide interchange protein DsbD
MARRIIAALVGTYLLMAAGSGWSQTPDNPFAAGRLKDDIRPEDVIHWEGVGGTASSDRATIEVGLRLMTEQSFTVYKERLKFSGSSGFAPSKIEYPTSKKIVDPIEQKEAEVFESGEFLVTFVGTRPLESANFTISVEYTGCTEIICLFPHTVQLEVPVSVAASSSTLASTTSSSGAIGGEASASESQPVEPEPASNQGFEQRLVSSFTAEGTPFWLVLILIFFGGLVSNLTPCVYPMIPITIRILSNTGHALWYAFCYGTGIVVTYTALGVFAGLTGSMFGKFMQNSWVNLGFGILMAVLALGMLGFGNLAGLQALGSRIGSGKPSARNTLLMGMGAGLVAAPCTGPIMLALLGYAANQGGLAESVLIFLVYSSGFALPYVFLGASTAKISKRTFSHHVQVAVKVVFAAVMFGLALYYFRIPLYKPLMALDAHWHNIAIGTATLGLILTALFVMRPELENDKRALVIPTVVLGIAIFATYKVYSAATGTLNWLKTEQAAFAQSAKEGKPVFIDGWAEWCLACIEMDKTTFVDPQVVQELSSHWILLKLDLTESTEENDALIEKYQFQGLPSYALLPKGGATEGAKVLAGKLEPEQILPELKSFRKAN